MPDGMPRPPPEPLLIVQDGIRYGVAIPGKVAWLPPAMWAAAAALRRRLDEMNERADRIERLYREAEDEAWREAAERQNAEAMRDA